MQRLALLLLCTLLATTTHASQILRYGHRGAAGLKPENTLPAYQTALALGVDYLDMDVGLSRDGIVVVHHDWHLNPATTRDPQGHWLSYPSPLIHELSFTELQQFDVGRINPNSTYRWHFPQQQAIDGTHIPSLRETIAYAKRHGGDAIRFQIELKTSPYHPDWSASPEELAAAVAKVLQAEQVVDRTEVHSFDWRGLMALQKILPELRLSFLTDDNEYQGWQQFNKSIAAQWHANQQQRAPKADYPELIAVIGGKVWCPNYHDVTREKIKKAHQLGLKVVVWTVDHSRDMKKLIKLGVDGIITNRPDRLNLVLSR